MADDDMPRDDKAGDDEPRVEVPEGGNQILARVSGKTVSATHSQGFDKALDAALANASQAFGPGSYRVDVTYFAELEVTNPGRIYAYGASVSQQGGS